MLYDGTIRSYEKGALLMDAHLDGNMIFEDLPQTPTDEELVDQAFSRAARAGRAKEGADAQLSMLQTAANIIHDNLANVTEGWPDFDQIHPFYYEIAHALVDVDSLRQSLNEVSWASHKASELRNEYQSKVHGDTDTARKHRKQAFARLADVVESVGEDLDEIRDGKQALRDFPDINPEEPTIVIAGYPNVGKSSFVNEVTRARNETASYPFTTTGIGIGHYTDSHVRYQLIDTPGLLDRPPEEANEIEQQATSALEHLADCVLVLIDASGNCGYPLEDQLALRNSLDERFDVPVVTVCNKADLSRDVEADYYMSVETGENLETVLNGAIDAIAHEPTLPFEE